VKRVIVAAALVLSVLAGAGAPAVVAWATRHLAFFSTFCW